MPKIVISYRRSDSSAIAGRIFDRLAAHYGEDSVFMDVDHIPLGIDFRTHIQETLMRADFLLAIVGPDWLGINDAGAVRMLEKTDPVRVEIETAVARKMPIIPVLVDGAKMPDGAMLPAELGNFAYLNAAEVATGRDFRSHMERLIGAIDRTSPRNRDVAPRRSAAAATQAVATAASAKPGRIAEVLRYFLAPLIVLLAAHHVIVNAFDLNTAYLWAVCTLVPLAFGFGHQWLDGRGAGTAAAFAIALGLIGVTAMTISESLNSGDPIMPQSRVEWVDNAQFAGAIALSFFAGYALARALRAASGRETARR